MSVKLLEGDCLNILPTLADQSVHAIVTDPPYGLSDHSLDDTVACLTAWLAGQPYLPAKKGFMSHAWDAWVPGPEIWRECLRVLKPGGHMLVFAGTRSLDLMTMAIRLAGFEVRDQLCWLNSQGMPHGLDISKAIDKAAGANRKVVGTKVNTYDGCTRDPSKHGNPADQSHFGKWGLTKTPHGMPLTEPATEEATQWQGWNSHLKPSLEPILLVRKPLDGTMVENVIRHHVGGLNVDACRIPVDLTVDDPRLGGQGSWSTASMAKNVYGEFAGTRHGSSTLGRFPANVLWDGSDEVREVFDSFGEKASGVPGKRRKSHETVGMGHLSMLDREEIGYADRGSVSRFYKACEYTEEERRIFYCAKASNSERITRYVEEVTVKWISDHGPCQVRLQAGTEQSHLKATDESGHFTRAEWSMFLSGKIITDLFPKVSKCIISTATSSTTESKTLRLLMHSLISDCTAVAKCEMANGGSLVENVEQCIQSMTFILNDTIPVPGASHAVSGTPLKISGNAKLHGHPTVKPISLMRYLVRLICPKGGTVLDPFAGTGTTGLAAIEEGFSAVLIEREEAYIKDCRDRLGFFLTP